MSQNLILVTGASGQVGSTGYKVIQELLKKGFRVRALVRSIDNRSNALQQLGSDVEIFKGDMLDFASVQEAVKGVSRIYFVYPVNQGLLQATTIIAKVAHDAGIKGIVNMSQSWTIIDGLAAISPASREHYYSELVLNWADVGAVHINPVFFLENYLVFAGPDFLTSGIARVPFDPQFTHTPIAANDVAVIIAKVLEDPEPYFGKQLLLSGPPANKGSWKDHIEIASNIIGKDLKFEHVPIEAWAKQASKFINDYAIVHLSKMALVYNSGRFDISVPTISKFIPEDQQTTIEKFFKKNSNLFSEQGAKQVFGDGK
jgi:NAD(P)H dehydrogenase (quinone)